MVCRKRSSPLLWQLVSTMTKQTPPKVATSKKVAPKNGKQTTGNAKKVAKNTKISSWDEIRNMTVAEFEANIDRLDFDALVNYKADTYYVKADSKKEHPKEAYFVPLVEPVGDKTHKFIGQTDAVADARFVYASPIEAIIQKIAYLKGNPYI